jgi:hypothetical protein
VRGVEWDDGASWDERPVLYSAAISDSMASIFFDVVIACASGCVSWTAALRAWRIAVLPNKLKIFTFASGQSEKNEALRSNKPRSKFFEQILSRQWYQTRV